MPHVIGIDLGSQSVKAVRCDETFRVVADHRVPIETTYPQPGWAEQDPDTWVAAVHQALAAVGKDGVAAIAIAGQLDGCVAVDPAGHALHPALIWQDRRATAEAALAERARVHAITGQVADASHMAAKIRWLVARGVRAARFDQPTSYVVARLTGASAIDPALASTTMLYDLAARAWSSELAREFAIDLAQLPALAPTCSIVGDHGGIPVAVGTGDDFATPLGAGLAAPGPIALGLGTAEVVGAISDAPVLDLPAARTASDPWRDLREPMVETHAFPTGAYFVEHPGWLSGGAVRWAARMLGLGSDAELDALAASAPAGAGGITFVPALAGQMTPVWRPELRGALHGLSAAHDRAHVARAVLEGLAFACRDVVERLAALGLPANELVALGGGAASRTWMQLRADVLGRPHHVTGRADTCAIGAAMIAAVAVGLHRDLATAAAHAPPPVETFQPRDSLEGAYARYREFAACHLL
ncbi:MAG TPA: FGGY family carbohydrate kinase [Kofleriaceae bacterium]|nr:FGGY family carbohydrate kinase [Kofleriaceae bacterium]